MRIPIIFNNINSIICPVLFSILVCFTSCSDKQELDFNDLENSLQYVQDGALISGMNFYCIPLVYENIHSLGFDSYTEFYKSVKTVSEYDDFYFMIEFDCNNRPLHLTDNEEDILLQSKLYEYLYEKGNYIRRDKQQHLDNYESVASIPFYSAYIYGDVEITSDKTLFGLSAGENLMNHLQIMSNYSCQPYGISEPYNFYHVKDLEKDTHYTLFAQEAWLRTSYLLKFKDIPNEKHDEIKFIIRFPLLIEYSSSYIASTIKGYDFHDRFDNVMFTSEITVKFKN